MSEKIEPTPYEQLMRARSDLMYIAANSANEDVQKQANIAWQAITQISFVVTNIVALEKENKQLRELLMDVLDFMRYAQYRTWVKKIQEVLSKQDKID